MFCSSEFYVSSYHKFFILNLDFFFQLDCKLVGYGWIKGRKRNLSKKITVKRCIGHKWLFICILHTCIHITYVYILYIVHMNIVPFTIPHMKECRSIEYNTKKNKSSYCCSNDSMKKKKRWEERKNDYKTTSKSKVRRQPKGKFRFAGEIQLNCSFISFFVA